MTKATLTIDGLYFDPDSAKRAVDFFARFLRHTKGRWAGHPFELEDWQRDEIIAPLFGWKRTDGTRRYRTAYIEVPRKNGKSTLSAGIALYMLFADNEQGAEVYSAAADRDQARIVFEQARAMVEESPSLRKRAKCYKNSIVVSATRSTYKVLSADAFTKHGLNASGIVFDELHAQPNRELYDVLNTSTGAREQPLMVMITTAGYNRESICWEQHEYARRILDGGVDDPSTFAYIAAAEEKDDWTKRKTWAKANPGMGVTVSEEYLLTECKKAQESPAYQNTFRRLHLNQWTSQDSRWIDMTKWDACAGELPDLSGRECYGGLDLASHTDIASLVLCFPPVGDDEPYALLPFFWIPEENMVERSRRDRVPYDAWVRDGLVFATPGNVIDYAYIRAHIAELCGEYQIKDVAFDRWGAELLRQQLEEDGITMVQMGQGYASMSAPSKELLRLVLSRGISHGGNPVLRWMADNVVVLQDPAGNVKPNKGKSREKIDGIVAGIMALDRATRVQAAKPSVYEGRGVLVL